MKSVNIVVGILAGFAAGAALGILFAPDKGSNTRNKISRKGHDYVDGVSEKLNDMKDNVANKFQNVKEGIMEFAHDGAAKAEEVGNTYSKKKY